MRLQITAAALLGLATVATATTTQDEEPLSFRDALASGTSWVKMRLRLETVDQDSISKDATAFTLRTVLGYETAQWKGFSALIEAEDVSPIGDSSYNDTMNGEPRPVVADPNGTETNQAYVQYGGWEDTTLRVGRQRITLGDHRFVGNVGWRQNEQTFDAWSVQSSALGGLDLYLAWVTNVNRVFGEDSPMGDAAMGSALFNVGHTFENVGRLEGYYYDLNYDAMAGPSTSTVGFSFGGRRDFDKTGLLYRLAFADQTDAHDNPVDVDAGYLNLEAGLDFSGFTVKLGQELLEGSGATGDKFTTPLATLHKFNGWADKFLLTPDTGLEDAYASLGWTWSETKMALVFHEFKSDTGGLDYGDEIDFVASRSFGTGITAGIKLADYSADTFSDDTQKLWFWMAYAF